MADVLRFTSPSVKPTPGEFVWALQKNANQVVCKLHDYGADGFELQLWHNDVFSFGRLFAARAEALGHADGVRRLLVEEDGWSLLFMYS